MNSVEVLNAGFKSTAGNPDPDGTVEAVAHLTKSLLPVAAEVSVMMLRGTEAHTVAATDGMARALDVWQYRTGQGPVLQAAAATATVYIADLSAETRWPGWGRHGIDAGARSVLSIGLRIDDGVTGALTVYATAPDTFPDAVGPPPSLAGYAAAALKTIHRHDLQATQVRHLKAAMVHRAVIEQAKGIIMAERRCSADEAFAVLVKISQNSNRKVHDIAADLARRTARTAVPVSRVATVDPRADAVPTPHLSSRTPAPIRASTSPGDAVTHIKLTTGVDQDGVAVISVAGELGMDSADELLAAVTAGLSAGPVTRMVVDLARVSFLDMAALGALLRARAAALQAGASLRIINPQPLVQRVLLLTDTHPILSVAS